MKKLCFRGDNMSNYKLDNDKMLLKLIDEKRDVDLLIKKGLKYSQISLMIDNEINKGNLAINNF